MQEIPRSDDRGVVAWGVRRCPGTNVDGSQCRRTWAARNNPGKRHCHDHPGGRDNSVDRGSRSTSTRVHPVDLPSPRTSQDSRPRPPTRTGRAAITPDVIAFAGRVVTDGWQSAVSDELAAALDDALWRALSSRKGSRTLCRNLAYIAREIEKIAETPKRTFRWTVKRAVRSQGGSTLEAEVAGKLVEHVAGDSLTLKVPYLADAVRVVRVTGVWSCLQGDLPLAGCECFKDLASGKTKELIKAELEAKIDGYVRV